MKKIGKNIVRKLGKSPKFSQYLDRFAALHWGNKDGFTFFFDTPEHQTGLKLIREVKAENEMLLSDLEAYQILMTVQKTEKLPGEIAEVGVYKGGSAKLIRETTKKPLHLFDTFEGLPNLSPSDDPKNFKSGDCYASLEGVKEYLKKYEGISYYKGLFPGTSGPIRDKLFSFVHLDVDMYESTRDSLEFFYSRMIPGGAIISHDYPSYAGVKRAFDEFFKDKPEIIIETFGTGQALVIKV